MVDFPAGTVVGAGTRLQSGLPVRTVGSDNRTNGLLLRGAVIKTYVADDDGHPLERYDSEDLGVRRPVAVYCDVLVYPDLAGQRWFGLSHVLVSQPVGGMHRGRIWKPRATSVDLATKELDSISDPAYLDGDHVLVGFMSDSFDQPIILRGLPHPSMDSGHESYERELGKRMRIEKDDYDPDYTKHHGVFYGVDDKGNFIANSTWGNDGSVAVDGKEPDPPKTGDPTPEIHGNQTFNLPMESKFEIVLWDMAPALNEPPDLPEEKMRLTFNKDKLHVKVTEGETLTVEEDGVDAKITLGDGLVKVAVADHLETLYTALKAWLEAITVSTGTGPSGTPLNNPAPSWDPDINSSQLLIPDTIAPVT